jgi:hypothetical protein
MSETIKPAVRGQPFFLDHKAVQHAFGIIDEPHCLQIEFFQVDICLGLQATTIHLGPGPF